MDRCIISLLFILCTGSLLQAQDELWDERDSYHLSADSLSYDMGVIPESLDANVDSLLRSWHVQYFKKADDFCHDEDENVFFHDSVYMERLDRLPRIIPMSFNQTVRESIDLYAKRRRSLVRYMLGMADFYFPIIEQILDEKEMPIELKYLAVVESALNPVALSRVGASGLWQFMLPTGKVYGLEINSLVDERRDPVKATEAACRYFKDLYDIYEDWYLVLAAYNCGPGNVNKAIRRAGGKNDFWQIFPFLPRETRSYVPLFIAANYIMNYHCEHNICPVETTLPLATDTIMIHQPLHLEQVAEVLNMDIEMLRTLNPQYKRDIIPGNFKPSVLKLPATQAYAFVGQEDTLYRHKFEELLANYVPASEGVAEPVKREQITHTTRQGENLFTIADRYGVTARDIRKWNGLGSNRVALGKRLKIWVDNGGIAFAQNRQKQYEVVKENATAILESKSRDGHTTYTVQSGDSLYSISKRFPGISAENIRIANDLPNSNIRPGQVLKIPSNT